MKVLKHGDLSDQIKITHIERYKLTCPKCGCEFVADWKEASSMEKTINNPKITFKCPDCGTETKTTRMGIGLYEYQSEDYITEMLKIKSNESKES